MSTKPPSSIKEFSTDSLEKIVYLSVATIPAQEPNDRNRLAYHVWRWLASKQGTLDQAISESGARLTISTQDAAKVISDALSKQGIATK
jgi:hypothetical protein